MAALGYLCVANSLAEVIGSGNPARAHGLAPGNGRISAELARARLIAGEGQVRGGEAADLARLALRQDASAVDAVTTLGLHAQTRGETGSARQLFAYAQRLSRRNLQTHLWIIEDAVSRNDIPHALRHYDLALRTSKTAPELLYPILSAAIVHDDVRINLAATLLRRPAWTNEFIVYLAENGKEPRAAARLLTSLSLAKVTIPTEATANLVKTLVDKRLVAEAWRYYVSVHPGTNNKMSRDPHFIADLAAPAPFDWVAVGDNRMSTSLQSGLFDFAAPAGAGGPVLQQMQMLSPGVYNIEGRSLGIEQPERSLPYWTLTCEDGRELGRIVVPPSNYNGGHFEGRIEVPAGCSVQTLVLVVRPSDEMGGVSGQIDWARLSPA